MFLFRAGARFRRMAPLVSRFTASPARVEHRRPPAWPAVGSKPVDAPARFALELSHPHGLWSSLDPYGEFIRIVGRDHDRASKAIQMAFIQVCEKAGIPFQESIGP